MEREDIRHKAGVTDEHQRKPPVDFLAPSFWVEDAILCLYLPAQLGLD